MWLGSASMLADVGSRLEPELSRSHSNTRASTSGWIRCGGGTGSAGRDSTDWTSQSSSSIGYSNSGSADDEGSGSVREDPEPDARGNTGGRGTFTSTGMAIDGVARKLTSMVDTGSS